MDDNKIGDMAWLDLTVDDADPLKDFYSEVIGWKSEACSMGDYNDYTMTRPGDGHAQAGVCHAKSVNADIPPVWMPYFLVADLDASIAAVKAQGGELITPVKSMGGSDTYVMIKDPAGAICALYCKK